MAKVLGDFFLEKLSLLALTKRSERSNMYFVPHVKGGFFLLIFFLFFFNEGSGTGLCSSADCCFQSTVTKPKLLGRAA